MWNQKVSHTCGKCIKREREREKGEKSQFHRNRKYICGYQGLKQGKKCGDADQRVQTLNYKNNF